MIWERLAIQALEQHDDANSSVEIISREELRGCANWQHALAHSRKDHRYYEIVEDTIPGFEYGYFRIVNKSAVLATQPFFIRDQDLLQGLPANLMRVICVIRRAWPRFMRLRTLMVGCVAGEGHIDASHGSSAEVARILAANLVHHARKLRTPMVVLKEFPAKYRSPLKCALDCGFIRVPSLPMTKLNVDYPSFEEYMERALKSSTRAKLRKKFRIADQTAGLKLDILVDVSLIVDQIYPLYLQVYHRSRLKFEKLTKRFFCEIGSEMPDTVRFFVWTLDDRIVAFTLCMLENEDIFAEYIGLDYSVALKLHLYHYAVRDMVRWSITNGYKRLRSSGLNYDPKLHFRHILDPLDLYVRHVSNFLNIPLRLLLPIIEPTRYDETLRRFANYDELWGAQ